MKQNKGKNAKGSRICLIIILLGLLILHAGDVLDSARNALILCYQTVIPALFPFLVLSGLLMESGFAEVCARCLTPLMKPLFGVSGAGAFPFTVGLISGYPVGAKVIRELYAAGKISRTEAEALLPFCNNAGPLFLIGAVGAGMLGSPSVGLFLYCIHGFSAFLVGFCLRFCQKKKNVNLITFTEKNNCQANALHGLSDAISSGVQTIFLVCGYIVLFAAVRQAVLPMIEPFLPKPVLVFLQGILEVTSGAAFLTSLELSPRILLSCLSFFIGTGGVCVFLQVSGVLSGSGITTTKYVFGKILQGLFAGTLAFVLFPLMPQDVQMAFAESGGNWMQAGNILVPIFNLFVLLATVFLLLPKQHRKRV